jgi:hypothetical protein
MVVRSIARRPSLLLTSPDADMEQRMLRNFRDIHTGAAFALLALANQAAAEAIEYNCSFPSSCFEAEYAGFFRGKITDNETSNPGLGHAIAYHRPGRGAATIYAYNLGRRGIPDGPTSEVVLDEFSRATREVLSFGGLATVGTVELTDRYGTGSPERGREFLCAEFILTDHAGPRRSFLYLTGALGRFVKIRVTLRTNDATDPAARHFADAVARQLWSKQGDRLTSH